MNYTTKSQKLCGHILCTNGAVFGGYCPDHQSDRAEVAEARAAQLEGERDTAWTELRVIRKTISADDNEATSDEVSRLFGKLTAERDEWKKLYLLRGKAIDDLVSERDEARRELLELRHAIVESGTR